MARKFTPKVITANALLGGDAVWLTEDDRWTRDIREAELITDEAHGDLRLLEAQARAHEIAGAYLADAVAGRNGPEPTHFREAFRTRGPSNYTHGKQAELS
ncbi:DUF2849 domain-containing protein [Yoonia sediminilitoris]|uniref:Uncharacterized protein DUF2849 n=1 Tax=Yoonia sediminilitoris TaxID=1286148 RepID=A0A2T6KRB1_9RHOB|nr:DUF2849 domain-containing protein [Yoonia sediminilitoris]PUB19098.1 uncharacterized protein DUF2849 [Yoonia sediminilitoris]RCW99266.1 uncharacterized protein DUF2849 [Yoonia sediminilitoris]